MEARLIEELAGLRGGQAKLKGIREEIVARISTLEQMVMTIDEACGDDPEMTEAVDSVGE